MICGWEDCTAVATEVLVFAGQPGHVHNCPAHVRVNREWSDVTRSLPIVGGTCPVKNCTPEPIYSEIPTPLGTEPRDAGGS